MKEESTMKKLFAGILFVTLLTAAAGTAFAGGHGRGHHRNSACYYSGSCNYTCGRDLSGCMQGRYCVDEDNDGVCDNCGYNAGGNGQGRNYVDADNDGVCDNYGTGNSGQGHHGGNGGGCHGGRCR